MLCLLHIEGLAFQQASNIAAVAKVTTSLCELVPLSQGPCYEVQISCAGCLIQLFLCGGEAGSLESVAYAGIILHRPSASIKWRFLANTFCLSHC